MSNVLQPNAKLGKLGSSIPLHIFFHHADTRDINNPIRVDNCKCNKIGQGVISFEYLSPLFLI